MSNETDFFVYIMTDPRVQPDNEPFYVGKGSGDRVQKHFDYRNHPNPHLGRRIACIEKDGFRVGITLIPAVDEVAAFALERQLIAAIGRRDKSSGPLCNMTDGGEGPSGKVVSELTRQRMSAAFIGRVRSAEANAKAAEKNRGKVRSEEAKAKMSAAQKARFADPIKRAEFCEMRKLATQDPEYRARLSAAKKGKPVSQATLDAAIAARTGSRHSEETKAKMKASHLKRKLNHD